MPVRMTVSWGYSSPTAQGFQSLEPSGAAWTSPLTSITLASTGWRWAGAVVGCVPAAGS